MLTHYELVSDMKPAGDQPQAIDRLAEGMKKGGKQTLLGVTGSGKTFTIANAIAKSGKSAIVISHNKTLAAQLYSEFKEFFPKNKVGYFVSYFDYYQPESYLPATDTYIEKDSKINERIERMRLQSTAHLMSEGPSIIVATVSCIYGLGSPGEYRNFTLGIEVGAAMKRKEMIFRLLDMQYERNETELASGTFQVKGGTFLIGPAHDEYIVKVVLDDDKITSISILEPMNRTISETPRYYTLFPAKHYLIPPSAKEKAIKSIRAELKERLPQLGALEAQRLKQRTNYDLEIIEEVGYCNGIENYSRHFDGREKGEPPFCLLDYLPKDSLIIIDESHVTLPQLHAMYEGDRTRKKSLVDYGFRLPSAFDNRPLKWEEFDRYQKNTVYVSATPAKYERETSQQIVELLVRPTGIIDPPVVVRPTEGQLDDVLARIKERAGKGMRTLVTTLTKRMAEDLAEYLSARDIRVRYLHSEIDTMARAEIIRQLRLGEFDCLVGINLLREGLDIPEVGLVAILDADKEGFLRNATSLIQTIGRAARNAQSEVVLYADRTSDAMQEAIAETDRRRVVQVEFNRQHHIIPQSIIKRVGARLGPEDAAPSVRHLTGADIHKQIIVLEEEMKEAAEILDFEKAIAIRDQIKELKEKKEDRDKLKKEEKNRQRKTKTDDQ